MSKGIAFFRKLGLLSSLLVIVLACQRENAWPAVKKRIRAQFPNVEQVSVSELHARLAEAERPVLLDVRREAEFAVSHLEGAIRVEPGAPLSLPAEISKDAPIVAYCSVGYRSSKLVQRLQAEGYTAVANLEGSIFEWANQGYPVIRDGEVVQQVHPYSDVWGRLLREDLRAYSAD